jgi:SAM-dependent methyltransferase
MTALSRQYVKLCDLADFEDPRIRDKQREIIPGFPPHEELRRKFWEYGMLGAYLDEVGALEENATALAVAAGHEEPLFWLANRIGSVVATDIYGDGDFSGREAAESMLTNPSSFAPYPYREDRLQVQHMNATNLEFPDDSFDIVFSLSSIEHFGSLANIRRAAAEMSRVLKPGGHLIIVTECLIGSKLIDSPKVQFAIKSLTLGRRAKGATWSKRVIDAFSASELQRDIVAPVGLPLDQPLNTDLSPETFDNVIHWHGAGELSPASGDPYPHLVLQAAGSPWTSAFLAFSKPAASSATGSDGT